MRRETPSCTHSTSTADASRGFRKLGPFMRLEALAAIEGSAAFVKMAHTGRVSHRPVPPRVAIAPKGRSVRAGAYRTSWGRQVRQPHHHRAVSFQFRHRIEQPMQLHGQSITTSCSVGVSVCPEDGADLNTLLKQANRAMYRQKAHRRPIRCGRPIAPS